MGGAPHLCGLLPQTHYCSLITTETANKPKLRDSLQSTCRVFLSQDPEKLGKAGNLSPTEDMTAKSFSQGEKYW